MLGHGGSPLPPHDARTVGLCRSGCSRLLDHLGLAARIVVGHSMGALVALEFALRAPGRVSAPSSALNAVFRRRREQRRAGSTRTRGRTRTSGRASGHLRRDASRAGSAIRCRPRCAGAAEDRARAAGERRPRRLRAHLSPLRQRRRRRIVDRLAGLGAPGAVHDRRSEIRTRRRPCRRRWRRLAPRGQCLVLRERKTHDDHRPRPTR